MPDSLPAEVVKKLIESSSIKDIKKQIDVPIFNFNNLIALFTKNQKDGDEYKLRIFQINHSKKGILW